MQCEDCGQESNHVASCKHCGKVVCWPCFAETHESVLPLGAVEKDFELTPDE